MRPTGLTYAFGITLNSMYTTSRGARELSVLNPCDTRTLERKSLWARNE